MSSTLETKHIPTKNPTVDDLSAQIQILRDDIASLTSTMGDYGKAKAQEARSTAQDAAAEAQMRAEEFVRSQPTTALGIAAGIGFLFGLVTARR